jgi:hypothetical protein
MTPLVEWQFGGWLRGLSPGNAWAIVAVAAVAGLAVVVWLYRRTLRQLSPATRNTLTTFRAAIVLLLLLCIANPVRVEKAKTVEAGKKTLAVVVDRSASMSQPDYRRMTRLADAVRVWQQHGGEAAAAFSEIKYYRFATELAPAASLDDAVVAAEPGPETHLYAALQQALGTNPSAIVCLTDGLDTTGKANDELANEALRLNVPLYFVAGMNRLTPAHASEVSRLREIKVPAKVLRQTQFSASAVFEVASPKEAQLPVELWRGDQKLAATRLPVRPGLNTLPWTVPVNSGEAGILPLEFRLGSGATAQSASRTVQVANETTVNVLYYQGALQWGFRFLRNALEGDPSFHLTAILNPALGVKLYVQAADQDTLPDLPDDVNVLKHFQIVVLAHVFADQLTGRQQQALTDYVSGGGSVLFISPDTEATRAFSGTALEQMLPVVFKSPSGATPDSTAAAEFQQQMRAIGGSEPDNETVFADQSIRRQTIPPLTPFVPGPDTAGAKLFLPGTEAPQFSTFAQVEKVKPGADIIAVAPASPAYGMDPLPVLVARQRFGDGFAAAMNTDLLWRWKLSLPSTSRAAETFWQQFMLSLVGNSTVTGLQLIIETGAPETHRSVHLEIDAAADTVPVVEVKSPHGVVQRLTPTRSTDTNGPAWLASFIPDEDGSWLAQASTPDGSVASSSILVASHAQARLTLEMMNLPPDVDGLRRLAESTGGAMIGESPVFQTSPLVAGGLQKIGMARPLWDTRWLAGLLLGLYAIELIVRRMFRLL